MQIYCKNGRKLLLNRRNVSRGVSPLRIPVLAACLTSLKFWFILSDTLPWFEGPGGGSDMKMDMQPGSRPQHKNDLRNVLDIIASAKLGRRYDEVHCRKPCLAQRGRKGDKGKAV